MTFHVTITNPSDGARSASDILVESATLSTADPDESGRLAPAGQAYLTFTATSGVGPGIYNSPSQPVYFGGMSPMPASALNFVSTAGKVYPAVRLNPHTPMSEFAQTDDGLVDATYYFVVPFDTQVGRIVIEPFRTVGYELNFTTSGPFALDVSGPTTIPVSMPKRLSEDAPGGGSSRPGATTGGELGSVMEWLVAAGVIIAGVALVVKRRRPKVDESVTEPTTNVDETRPAEAATAVVRVEPENATVADQLDEMFVGIMGPVIFRPPLNTTREAIRGIATYLAVYHDRPQTRSEVITAVYPTSSTMAEVTEGTFLNRISETRAILGPERFPEAKAGRYQLANVRTDWELFQHRATDANGLEGDARRAMILDALGLVRGEPFVGEGGRHFLWVREKGLDHEITRAVIAVAHNGLRDFLNADDLAGAEEILRHGLRLAPAATILWEDLTDVLLEHHDQSLMKRHFDEARAFLSESDVEALRQREDG